MLIENPHFSNRFWQVKQGVISYYGGPDQDRTGDLIVANDALSQLSYKPINMNINLFCFTGFSLEFSLFFRFKQRLNIWKFGFAWGHIS